MSQPGNQWRNAENHWSQQRYSRTPEGPWRIPNEVAEPENVEMQATQNQTNTEEGLRRAFVSGFSFGSVTIRVVKAKRLLHEKRLKG